MTTTETLSQQWSRLSDSRAWVCEKLRTQEDKKTREALFQVQLFIGFALIRLDEVNHRTDGAYDKQF